MHTLGSQIHNSVKRYQSTVMPIVEKCGYIPGGVLPSEMLAFLCLCIDQKVDLVMESGRHLGFSTRVFCQFPGHWRVWSVDNTPIAEVDSNLQKDFPSLKLDVGDGNKKIRSYIAPRHRNRIALLLDGPKGDKAADLAGTLRSQICFAALHDFSEKIEGATGLEPHQARKNLTARGWPIWYSDEPAYVKQYGRLDRVAWHPTYQSREHLTAAGFTLAFIQGDQFRSDQ